MAVNVITKGQAYAGAINLGGMTMLIKKIELPANAVNGRSDALNDKKDAAKESSLGHFIPKICFPQKLNIQNLTASKEGICQKRL